MEPSSAYRNSVTRRNEFFAKLKPVCVEISKAVMRQETISSATKQELIRLADQLYGILTTQTAYDASVLDSKLAEYVFFPLSFIFRKKEQCPARLVENAVKVVRVLIQYGWKSSISKELSQQLLILLTFLVGGVPGQPRSRDSPEETALEGFRALTALMRAAGSVSPTSSPLTDIHLVPAMGHTITVILDGIKDGETADIRLEALDAIQALFTSVKDLEALASFFPGTVSSLATVLSPPESLKTQRRVLIRTLQVLKTILVNVMGDMATRDIQKKAKDNVKDTKPEKMLTPAWLEATAAQVKLALSTVLKLRKHDSFEVRRTVEVFTVTLLDECHSSLANCTSILVESAIIAGGETFIDTSKSTHGLASIDPKANLEELARVTNLEDLATIYPELGEVIKTTVYDWITSLPRTLQSSDEDVKKQAIQNLMKGNKLIRDLHLDSSMIEDSLATTLRDSVVTLVRNSKESKVVGDVDFDDSFSGNRSLVKSHSEEPEFLPVIMAQDVQSSTRQELATFIASIGTPAQQAMLASEMLAYVQDAEGIEQISAYWLAFQLLKSSCSKTSEVDSFLDLSMLTNASDNQELVFNELYTFSVSTLSSHSDTVDVDWRLEAVALEITAFASSRMGASFRPELIDVLYPVSTLLGSPTPQLRRHAITTLNIIAASCGYDNVSAMIIDNADYMVNSISLRLNTLDISPASTKVLTMMIRLTGPSLIPYLDDVIAAIFAALDNYHGYPAFVSSLFEVLGEVVEQGAKSDVLLLESKDRVVSHRKRALEATRTEDIVDMLADRTEKRRKQRHEVDVEEIVRGRPQQPWKSEAETMLDQMENPEQEQGEQSSGKEVDKAEVPKTPTYQILSRIVTLTQHYLTSPTPTLRKSLLDLLKTVAPALAPDENAFLPLINSVWPVLVSRLYDREPYVAIAACGALAALCEAAGDFLASRIKTEWWDRLGKWCKKSKRDAAQHGKGRGVTGGRNLPTERGRLAGATVGLLESNAGDILIPTRSESGDLGVQLSSTSPASSLAAGSTTGLGRFAQEAQIWEAAVQLLTAIVSFVRLDDEIFDEIVDLLADTLARNDAAREALEVVNADAVWLALYLRGEAQLPTQPHLEGAGFANFEPATNLVR